MRLPVHVKYLFVFAFLIFGSINFTRTAFEILKSSKRLEDLKEDVTVLESEKTRLEEDIKYKQTNDYIDERARNDLNLIKPGEKLFVVEGINLKKSDDGQKGFVLGKSDGDKKEGIFSKDSNPYLWYELFFK